MNTTSLTLTALLAALALSACNTMQGFGTDMRDAGQGLHDTAVKASGDDTSTTTSTTRTTTTTVPQD